MRLVCIAVVLLGTGAVWAEGTTIRGDQLYSAGTAALQKGDFALAEKSFRQLRTEFPEDLRWGPGLTAAIRQDAHLQDAIEMAQNMAPDSGREQMQYFNAGQALMIRDRSREALAEFENSLRFDDTSTRSATYLEIGIAHSRLKETEEAMAAYRSALKEDPTHPIAMNNLAYEWAERGENLGEALAYAKRAGEALPTNAAVLDTLGWVYFKNGMFADAELTLEQSLQQERKTDAARAHLAAVMDARGEWTDERRELRKLMQGELSTDQLARMKELLRKTQAGK